MPGRIRFIGSDAGSKPRERAARYSIAQSSSDTLRRALQAEWATSSTAVGSFTPGLIDTDMVRGFMQRSPEEFPAKAADEDLLSNGRIASAQMMGCFASWLLLDVGADRFATTDRDVSDTDHHDEWTNGVRYPNLRS